MHDEIVVKGFVENLGREEHAVGQHHCAAGGLVSGVDLQDGGALKVPALARTRVPDMHIITSFLATTKATAMATIESARVRS